LGSCIVAVQACLGSIVYRAEEVHAVGNFANTSKCYRASMSVVRNGSGVTINRIERSMHVVRVQIADFQLDFTFVRQQVSELG
jgi:hypothetical protein